MRVAGTYRQRATAGDATRPRPIAADSARNLAINSIAASRPFAAPRPARRSAPRSETMVPLAAFAQFRPGQHAARRQPPGPVRRHHDLLQSRRPGTSLSDAQTRDRPGDGRDPHARHHPRQLRRHGARPSSNRSPTKPLLIAAALAGRLYRAGHSLRELHPSAHDPLDAALGGRRRAARADRCSTPNSRSSPLIGIILLIGIVKKNAIMMIDFALQAQRDGADAARGDLPGLPAAVPPDHDDDLRRAARRAAARLRHGRRLGTAPSAGHLDRRRPDRQSGVDALYDPGHLSLSRPAQSAAATPLAAVLSRAFGRAASRRLG